MTKKSKTPRTPTRALAALGLATLVSSSGCARQDVRESLGSTTQAVKNGAASANTDVVVLYSLGAKVDEKWSSKDIYGSAVRLCPDVLLTVSHVAAMLEAAENARVSAGDKVFGAKELEGVDHDYYFVEDSGIKVDQIVSAFTVASWKLPPEEATKTIKNEGFHLLHLNKPLPGAGGAPLPKADAVPSVKKGDRAMLVGYGFGSGQGTAALDGVRREGEIAYLEGISAMQQLFVPPAAGGAFGAKNDSGGGVFLNAGAKNRTLYGLEASGYERRDAAGRLQAAPYNGENDLVLPLTAEVITAIEKVLAEKKWCQGGLTRPVAAVTLPPGETAIAHVDVAPGTTAPPAPSGTMTTMLVPSGTTTALAPTVTSDAMPTGGTGDERLTVAPTTGTPTTGTPTTGIVEPFSTRTLTTYWEGETLLPGGVWLAPRLMTLEVPSEAVLVEGAPSLVEPFDSRPDAGAPEDAAGLPHDEAALTAP